MTEKPLVDQSTESQNTASESLGNQGVLEPEIDLGGNRPKLTFEQINEVTWKVTDGRGSNAWSGDRSGSYRSTRAVAWLKVWEDSSMSPVSYTHLTLPTILRV